jgi:nicotinamide riboside transporter PnuC
VLYAAQGLQATAVLFVIYSVLAVRGYVQWRRDTAATLAVHA